MRVAEGSPRINNQMTFRKQQKKTHLVLPEIGRFLKQLFRDEQWIFTWDNAAEDLHTSAYTHSEHTFFLRFCFSRTTLSTKFCINQGSPRGQTSRRYIYVCVYINSWSGLCKWGSWLSRLRKAVDTIPDSGARSPQGRQSGKIRSSLKPTGTSWHPARTD